MRRRCDSRGCPRRRRPGSRFGAPGLPRVRQLRTGNALQGLDVLKILTNTFINKYRRRVLEHAVTSDMERGGDPGLLHESGSRQASDPEDTLHFQLMSDSIARALSALPEEYRLAVLLSDVKSFPTARSPTSWNVPWAP